MTDALERAAQAYREARDAAIFDERVVETSLAAAIAVYLADPEVIEAAAREIDPGAWKSGPHGQGVKDAIRAPSMRFAHAALAAAGRAVGGER